MQIYDFISRMDTTGILLECTWSEFKDALKQVTRTDETYAEYLSYSKEKQSAIKDIGGYIAGTLNNGHRGIMDVMTRSAITLDLDSISKSEINDIYNNIEKLEVEAFTHTTRNSTKDKPRIRLIIPLKNEIKAIDYEHIARYIAFKVGIKYFDKTTFHPNRIMYYPSCSNDSEFIYKEFSGKLLDIENIRNEAAEWANIWGKLNSNIKVNYTQQEDPTTKPGIIGDFCRAYTIEECIREFLSDKYEKVKENRYIYKGSISPAGAVIYDNKFLYSFHSTDDNSLRLLNAYDLVRVNLFNDIDESVSIKRMNSFIRDNEAVQNKIREINGTVDKSSLNKGWKTQLKMSKSGEIKRSLYNVSFILQNDPNLAKKIGFNVFANKIMLVDNTNWRLLQDNKPSEWTNYDDAKLCQYISDIYDIELNDQLCSKAVLISAMQNKYNPVADYITSIKWDGKKRVETLFIDYLGAKDCDYVREITRLTFIACVKRAMYNDVKWDDVIVLSGAQGIGKSTIFRKLGREWFNDSVKTFEGDRATEIIQGYWICEIPELSAYRASEINDIKHFLSKEHDIYRQPYTRHPIKVPRKQVFFGTTNSSNFLKDETGNRRFYPIDVDIKYATKSVFNDLDDYEVAQFWAECVEYAKDIQYVVVPEAIKKAAQVEQLLHEEQDPRAEAIKEYLERKIPIFWFDLSVKEQREYMDGTLKKEVTCYMERDRVTASEIWEVCFKADIKDFNKNRAKEINNIIKKIEGWKEKDAVRFGNRRRRGFIMNADKT